MASIITKIRVEGMREARRNAIALQRLTTGSMREALRTSIRPMVRAAKANAPVRTGLLKKSITFKIVTRPRQELVFAIIGPDKRVHGGTASGERIQPSRYAHLVELGTPHSAAHPFLRPAYEAERQNTLNTYGKLLGPSIEKVAARLSRTTYQPGRRR